MIDINFDFTTDSPGYWDGFWEKDDGFGYGGSDPDKASPTLRKYHQLLWSKELPKGEMMELKQGKWADYDYLTWKDFRFGSDSIIVEMKYERNKAIVDQVFDQVKDYKAYYEHLIRRPYTIGGMVIFPKHPNSINQRKGMSKVIADRWDLTMECIRRYYIGEKSPLYSILLKDKAFFDLFVDFKGYVDFFLLQDCVSEDYSQVNLWCGKTFFEGDGLPPTLEEYFRFIENEHRFLDKRNKRIQEYCIEHNL